MSGKVIIISAPSGAGKTTIVKHLLARENLHLEFSVSACTRPRREDETEGRDYYFMTVDEFKAKIEDNMFLEWEEVYKGSYYGTLKSEVERIWKNGNHILFDVDVEGAVNLKQIFKEKALSVFIMPPSIEELQRRLEKRGMDTPDKIRKRINKAGYEMKFVFKFDRTIINDVLNKALQEADDMVLEFLKRTEI
ncbi:MAG: guanylate kinase [Bacteroidetes bacterium RBG_13_46_8]|nr:MAG: guanylate kinase [Bacteroidetes bacterium RBG_13_46_8]